MHDSSSFVTLTYSDEHLPEYGFLRYRDFQLFMKRVVAKFGPTRFFMCGEYGDDFSRPHYHVGLFGLDFRSDRKLWRKSDAGYLLFRSATLERLWALGNSEIGDLTRESAAYMARYTFKKVNGDLAADHYRFVVPDTGEVLQRPQEFARMSLRGGGIGKPWFERFHRDVYPHDRVVVGGVEAKPPRYYDVLLERMNPELAEELKQARIESAKLRQADNTPERLAVRELVTKARVSTFRRK